MPIKYQKVTSGTSLDGSNPVIFIVGQQSETFGFATLPPFGRQTTIYFVNVTENDITLTFPANLVEFAFVNGSKITQDYTITVQPNKSKGINLFLAEDNDDHVYAFTSIM